MGRRVRIAGGLAILLLALVGGGVAWWLPDAQVPDSRATQPLPVPPVPPRVAQGERYEHCLTLLPEDPQGAESYARSWQGEGGGAGAAHCLALARIALGAPTEGATLLEQVARDSDAPGAARAVVYDQAAQAWLMAGQAARAFAVSTEAVSLAPEMPDLLIDRALAAEALARWQDAVGDLGRALDAEPRRPDALVLRASALRHLGQIALAAQDVDRALALDPDNAEALLERGILRQRGEDRSGARADWERAIAVAPDSQAAELAQQNLALLEAGPKRR
jgi:tetratricopeptide (TPR) repeat protein